MAAADRRAARRDLWTGGWVGAASTLPAMDRRRFLQGACLLGGSTLLGGPTLLTACSGSDDGAASRARPRPLLDVAARQSPIDTVVVVMMENRSFDHYLGWLADDEDYLERGRSRFGDEFGVAGRQRQEFAAPDGTMVPTTAWLEVTGDPNPYRGCGHPDPGHGWDAGRAQRDGGFLAPGSGNDRFALGYYEAAALPLTAQLAREFTVFDHWHAAVLGPTYPNRNYLHSGQSGEYKDNTLPFGAGQAGYPWETIWDRLRDAGVPARYYYSDLPVLALWGERLASVEARIERYFEEAEAGRLPNVVMVDPAFLSGARTDDHPHGDIRAGQRFVRDVFRAFVESPHWARGLFVLTYDEWGGFFDHVAPPTLPDDRASASDEDNFGQAGFRVPAVVASPYAERGFVESHIHDHTAVLRFIEWRFLGAPATGAGNDGGTWFLTTRDRNARNLGASLRAEEPEREVGFDLDAEIGTPSAPCAEDGGPALPPPSGDAILGTNASPAVAKHSYEVAMDQGFFDRVGRRIEPSPMAREWATGGAGPAV
jgi:phospholipase C